ncbi:PAS domain S-box protein [Rhizobium leucaenae]|uniref:Blue-light-activated histidine kinase n=1 Tax=Rhizobium leucaenae TaxID=29450 RepID=A0A7W6ZQC3_9HYPH|nr:PAS domain S-box protein [Rhizobium leucaenae]MBB4566784.1 PAS domain S-box-containing protein [Rhizobium leucaenae]MBB6300592.1 PAS domain S-box-containing protein [Rhizobium leucaenae]
MSDNLTRQFGSHAPSADAWLAAIVENSDDAIISKTLGGIITSWNRGAEHLFGFEAKETIGLPITILIPDDRLHEETTIIGRIRAGERVDHYETVRRRKDGSLVDVSLTVSPIRDADGTIIGASKIARDISERKRERERQKLLLREMNHRIKNLFAITNALITMSQRSATSAQDLADNLRRRIVSLARAHDLTLPDLSGDVTDRSSTTLFSLFDAVLAVHREDGRQRIEIHGSDSPVGGSALTSLALLLHEFATNAIKYGALSLPDGQIRIDLATDDELSLIWTETGGPAVTPPGESAGFGSLLERVTIEGSLSGSITREWRPEGLRIHLRVPLENLTR